MHIQNLEAPSNRTPPNERIPSMHGQLKTAWCFFSHAFNPLQNRLQKGLEHKGLRVTHFNKLELL